jgi:RsiW-degrading membrane proteinase PrsW (M82 family)
MIPWWWLILTFFGGLAVGFTLTAILSTVKVSDEAEAWLRRETRG